MNTSTLAAHPIPNSIAEMSAQYATGRENATGSASAVMECIVAATSPLVGALFTGGTLQERLLFSLIMAGACAHLGDHSKEDYSLTISVTPDTIREAINVYQRLTSKDIRPYLPQPMLKFAASALN